MPEYFGGAPNAFQGGVEFGATQRRRRKDENALNALIEQYGPEAADPQSTAMMQRVQQSETLHPYDVSEAQRVDAARAAAVQQRGAPAGDPAGERQGIEIEDRANAQKLDAGRRAAAVLQLVKARGGDMDKAFDMVSSILPSFGVPAESLAEAKQAVLTDPDSVDELIAMLTDPAGAGKQGAMSAPISVVNKATGELELKIPMADGRLLDIPGFAAAGSVQGAARVEQGADRIAQGYTKIDWDRKKQTLPSRSEGIEPYEGEDGNIYARIVPGSKAAEAHNKGLRKEDVDDRSLVKVGRLADESIPVLKDATGTAAKYFSEASDGFIPQTLRRASAWAPSTDAHEAWRALETVKGMVGAGQLQAFREASATGASGFGALSERELDLLERLRGDLTITGDPKKLAQTIQSIYDSFERLHNYTKQDAAEAVRRMEERKAQFIESPKSRAPGAAQRPIGGVIPNVEELSDEELSNMLSGGT